MKITDNDELPIEDVKYRYKEVVLTDDERERALYQARMKKSGEEYTRKYWDRVNAPRVYEHYDVMTVEQLIRNTIKQNSFTHTCKSYEGYDDIVSTIAQYICGEGPLDPNKGLLLMGPVGCGKTELMNAIRLNQKQSFLYYTSVDIVRTIANEGSLEFIDRILKLRSMSAAQERFNQQECGVFVDEIGSEGILNLFGNKREIMAELIADYYATNFRFNRLLHGTTNLNGKQIAGRYGERIASRMKQMMNVVLFPEGATDFRG